MVLDMHDPMVHQLNITVQAIFIADTASEWLVYKTIGWGVGLIRSLISNVVTLVWMELGVEPVCELSTGCEDNKHWANLHSVFGSSIVIGASA